MLSSGARVPPGALERVPGAPGDETVGVVLSDDRQSEGREGGIFPCEPVHGCLERTVHATRGRLARARCVGQVPGDPVREQAPESWTGVACLGALYSQFVWRRFVYCDVFDEFRGVKNGWHGDTPCLRMLPIGYGGCLLRSSQYGGTDAASGEGQSSIVSFLISVSKYPTS